MKVYPISNRIQNSNDAKAEIVNEETRQLFEVGNGGIDEWNIEEGNSASGGAGLDNSNFKERAFHQVLTHCANATSSTDLWSLPDDSSTNNMFRVDSNIHFSNAFTPIEPGWVTGQYQVSFSVAMLDGNSTGLIPYTQDAFESTSYHRHAIYANGAKVGETDIICEAPIGTVNVPFQFYHPGGDLQMDLYAGTNGGDAFGAGEPYRLVVHKAYYWLLLRKR
jgi:hypothetical protein